MFGSELGVLDRLLRGCRLEEVLGELGEVRPGLGPMAALQLHPDPPVQIAPPARGDRAVERVTHQSVREAQQPRRPGRRRDQPRRDRLVKGAGHVVIVVEALEHCGIELAPENRSDRQRPPRCLRKALQAAVDRLAHTGRNDRPRVGAVQPTLCSQEPHGLHDEQRVSGGAFVDCLDHGLRCPAAGTQLDVLSDLLAPEPAQRDPSHGRLSDHVTDQPVERVTRLRLGVAVRAEHRDAGVPSAAGKELEQQQRGLVGRVEVVQHDQQGALVGDGAKEDGDRVEQPKAQCLRVMYRRAG